MVMRKPSLGPRTMADHSTDVRKARTGEPGGAVKSYWQGRKVLVTGAGGFIGSHLTERLVREGARVRALLHYNSRGDWGNLELCPEKIRSRPTEATASCRSA